MADSHAYDEALKHAANVKGKSTNSEKITHFRSDESGILGLKTILYELLSYLGKLRFR